MQKWNRVSLITVETLFRDAVKESTEAIKVLLRERVIFMIVATRAAERYAEPGCGGRLNAIHNVFVLVLFRDCAALEVDHVVAIEAGCDDLGLGGVRQHIARNLFHRELVIGHVTVKCTDHPIAPRPHLSRAVDVISVRVGIAGEIEPLHRHPLTVMRRGEQPIDHLVISIRRIIGQERIQLSRSGRQSGQIECHATQQNRLIGFGRRMQSLLLELCQHEIVNRSSHPRGVFHGRKFRPLGWNKRPM